jgi:hypothetical protein
MPTRNKAIRRRDSSAHWNDRLTCVPVQTSMASTTRCGTNQAHGGDHDPTDLQQWSEAAHNHEREHGVSKTNQTQLPAQPSVHPKTRVFRWFEHIREVTGISASVLIPHEWTLYTASPPPPATSLLSKSNHRNGATAAFQTTAFFAHTLLQHLAAVFASTCAPGDNAKQTLLYTWALAPEQLSRCASRLVTADLECVDQPLPNADPAYPLNTSPVEVLVRVLYEDQRRRFETVKRELHKASVSEASPLHTLFQTFSPAAQACSVVQKVLLVVWDSLHSMEHPPCDVDDVTEPGCVRSKRLVVASDSYELLRTHFRRTYDDTPDVRVLFCADAVYVCSVYQLDGQLLGEATNAHREVAVQQACAEALRTLHVQPHF